MNTARILSIAAVAAFASIGAQAAELNGDLYGTGGGIPRPVHPQQRREVRAEGVQALPNFARARSLTGCPHPQHARAHRCACRRRDCRPRWPDRHRQPQLIARRLHALQAP